MSTWNGVYEPADGADGADWRERYLARLTEIVGPVEGGEEMAETAYREADDVSPEEAAEDEAREWAEASDRTEP